MRRYHGLKELEGSGEMPLLGKVRFHRKPAMIGLRKLWFEGCIEGAGAAGVRLTKEEIEAKRREIFAEIDPLIDKHEEAEVKYSGCIEESNRLARQLQIWGEDNPFIEPVRRNNFMRDRDIAESTEHEARAGVQRTERALPPYLRE